MRSSSEVHLKTVNITKKFGGLIAVNKVSIEVLKSSITLLIGPNGCGKTTLVNTITGVYKPDGGRVYFNGEDITGLPPDQIYKKGLVRTFQIPSPFTKLSVLDNLLVAARGNPGERFRYHLFKKTWLEYEVRAVEKAFEIMRILNIERYWDREVSELDAGALKLIEIGRALMSDASMIILDEPIAGVNPRLAHDIFSHIVNVRNKLGITFLIIEHRLDIALKYVDHVYVMNQGMIISSGTPSDIVRDEKVRTVYLGVSSSAGS
ncbi:MAG: ABC transporter ATP-binding protein [Sulfolobales archaeon]